MQTIFLEFKHEPGNLAANGTDMIFYIDGRWKWETTREKIYERVAELRRGVRASALLKQEFVGFTYFGDTRSTAAIHSMRDLNPPAWASEKTDRSSLLSNKEYPK